MKNNVKIVLLAIIIIFLSIILIKIYDTDINPIIKNNTIIKQNKMLTMMFESTTETGVYEANDEETSFDQENYYFNSNLSGCEHGGTVSFDDGTVTMQSSYTDKCFVYFDKSVPLTITTVDDIVRNALPGTTNVIRQYSDTTTSSGLFYISDGMYGNMTYYYRGKINNNWVKFGKENGDDIYWRIIRFNGDKSIRMIYSGTTAPTEETQYRITDSGTQIADIVYYSDRWNSKYVGFYYDDDNPHGTTNPSYAADYLLNEETGWYYTSGLSNYSSYIADGKFCNDRTIVNSTNYPGTGSGSDAASTRYSAANRYWNYDTSDRRSIIIISTHCPVENDIFNVKVGLITADDALMGAGAYISGNYLATEQYIWTMTPFQISSNGVVSMGVLYPGALLGSHSDVNRYTMGVRPVINLKSGTTFKAGTDGTWQHPYEVV